MITQQQIFEILTKMSGNEPFKQQIFANPAKEFAMLGLDLKSTDYPGFNDFFKSEIEPEFLKDPALFSFKCKACEIGCYAIAAAIIVIGAAGLALLTVDSGVVIALADFASVSAAAALAFITALVSLVVFTVSSVALSICKWTDACK